MKRLRTTFITDRMQQYDTVSAIIRTIFYEPLESFQKAMCSDARRNCESAYLDRPKF